MCRLPTLRSPSSDQDAVSQERDVSTLTRITNSSYRPHKQDGAHLCAVSLSVLRPQTRTQCHKSATSLRKQPSKLPFKRLTPHTGQCTGMYTAASKPGPLLAVHGYRGTRPSMVVGRLIWHDSLHWRLSP